LGIALCGSFEDSASSKKSFANKSRVEMGVPRYISVLVCGPLNKSSVIVVNLLFKIKSLINLTFRKLLILLIFSSNMPYKLELDRVISEVKEREAKQVLVQIPDGLKTKAAEIVDFIEENTEAKAFIFFGNCFGACDLPLGLDILKIDLMVQFGHNRFNKEEW